MYRAHSDRAREFVSRQAKQWFLDRGIVQTLTNGSAYITNGRAESEINMVKKSIRTIITANGANACPLDRWPLAARHISERRLRNQLHHAGWPVGRLLRFGPKAYALKKSWQDGDLGPAIGSSITTTTYFVKSTSTGRCFYADDIVMPTEVPLNLPDLEADPGGDLPHLPEREEAPAQPLFHGNAPTRRLRRKTAPPRAISLVSMLHIEGRK